MPCRRLPGRNTSLRSRLRGCLRSSPASAAAAQRPCQLAGGSAVSAGDTAVPPSRAYNLLQADLPPRRTTMTQATIEVSGLRKRFGPALALDGMSFTVRPGLVTGFVGPNGAGKSTTMRVIRSLRRPLSHLGSLLDAGALQPSRTARNHLLWLAHSQGLGARRVDEVIEAAGLQQAGRRRAGGFSLGMRQRLGIAAALLGDPPALMLDEPFNGMDPDGITWMRGFLRSLAWQGRAVLVSSHLMSELQDCADHLVVAGRGQVIADATVADLLAAASGDRVTLRTAARPAAAAVL